ncbi:HIT family protein [Streptomyces sp. TLI_146]|uniref:HIT family protein n=1 Tax=Streptomyces sp. TLI_146 TaxID=1938858 RepID=UPI000C703037|nr:HIT family protein [Streptomyces sp. TLI_146]
MRRIFSWVRPGGTGRRSADDGNPDADTCLFCRRERPDLNRIMHENKTFYIRYDNFPAAEGHVEIVPKRHVESFFQLTTRELKDAYSLIRFARENIDDRHHPDGYTIGVNEGRAAGRTIDHLHIHLIPRHHNDVADPRGGIRRAVPNCEPDTWTARPEPGEKAAEDLAGAHRGRN